MLSKLGSKMATVYSSLAQVDKELKDKGEQNLGLREQYLGLVLDDFLPSHFPCYEGLLYLPRKQTFVTGPSKIKEDGSGDIAANVLRHQTETYLQGDQTQCFTFADLHSKSEVPLSGFLILYHNDQVKVYNAGETLSVEGKPLRDELSLEKDSCLSPMWKAGHEVSRKKLAEVSYYECEDLFPHFYHGLQRITSLALQGLELRQKEGKSLLQDLTIEGPQIKRRIKELTALK